MHIITTLINIFSVDFHFFGPYKCLSEYIYLLIYLFIIWRRERTQAGERQAEREEEAGSPLIKEPRCGPQSQDPGFMAKAKGRCLTHWATQMSHLNTYV